MVKIIQHDYTTHQYNTKIGILSGKEKPDFIEVEKEGTYIWIGLGFSLYSLTKQTMQNEKEQKKND